VPGQYTLEIHADGEVISVGCPGVTDSAKSHVECSDVGFVLTAPNLTSADSSITITRLSGDTTTRDVPSTLVGYDGGENCPSACPVREAQFDNL
jgi:hypothetical protein